MILIMKKNPPTNQQTKCWLLGERREGGKDRGTHDPESSDYYHPIKAAMVKPNMN